MEKIYIAEFDAQNKLFMKKLNDAERKTQQTVGRIEKITKNLGATMLASFGVHQVIGFLNESIKKFAEQEQAVKKLDTTFGRSTISLQRYAANLQKVTTYGDEVIINGMALLGMFVKDEEQVKKLSKATLDLAAAKGMDLTAAFDLVAKSVGSTTNALTRYGVNMEGAAGSSDRINSALENMNKLFEGQAIAKATTDAGKLEQAMNRLGDTQEKIGEKWLPIWLKVNEEFNDFLETLIEIYNYFELLATDPGEYFNRLFGGEAKDSLKETSDLLKSDRELLEKGLANPETWKNIIDNVKKANAPLKETTAELEKQVKLWRSIMRPSIGKDRGMVPMSTSRQDDQELAMKEWRASIRPVGRDHSINAANMKENLEEAESPMNALVSLSNQMASNFQFAGHTFVGQLSQAIAMVDSISNMILTVASMFGGGGGGFGLGGLLSLIGLEKGGRFTGGHVSKIPSFASGGSYSTPMVNGSLGGGYPVLVHKNETLDVYNSGQTSRLENKLDTVKNAIMAGTLASTRGGGGGQAIVVNIDGKKLFEINAGRENRSARSGKNKSEFL